MRPPSLDSLSLCDARVGPKEGLWVGFIFFISCCNYTSFWHIEVCKKRGNDEGTKKGGEDSPLSAKESLFEGPSKTAAFLRRTFRGGLGAPFFSIGVFIFPGEKRLFLGGIPALAEDGLVVERVKLIVGGVEAITGMGQAAIFQVIKVFPGGI